MNLNLLKEFVEDRIERKLYHWEAIVVYFAKEQIELVEYDAYQCDDDSYSPIEEWSFDFFENWLKDKKKEK